METALEFCQAIKEGHIPYSGRSGVLPKQKFNLVCGSFEISRFFKTLVHTHVLRHTRALEMVRAGVSLTIVQQILGHSNLNTTAVYLYFSGQEAKTILRDRGLI